MTNTSLARKLFWRITPTIFVTIFAIGAFAFSSADREINNIYDAQLINNANVLWMLLQDDLVTASNEKPRKIDDIDFSVANQLALNEDADDYADAHMLRAWKNDKLVLYSNTAFPEDVNRQTDGFSKKLYKNELWRMYTLPIPKTQIVIELGEKIALRDTLVSNIVLNLFFPLLVLIPIIGVLVWYGIASGLGVVHTLVRQIKSRSPDDLSEIAVDELPKDLAPLGDSLNQLLTKLEHSLAAERRFSDHAAHQLRTPQASLKLLLQMLATAEDEAERKEILKDLIICNDRATQLVEQLLRSARVSHQPITLKPVLLHSVVAALLSEMAGLIKAKSLDVRFDYQDNIIVRADEAMLLVMVSNVLENAIKYTPVGGKIVVSIHSIDDFCRLTIEDNGDGIPEADRDQVFQRFYRVGTPEQDGAGLGLAIVAEILNRLGGRISLKTPESGQGLLVEILMRAL